MRSSLVNSCKPFPSLALIAALALLLSGWTCSIQFNSCQGVGSQPQITSLSPSSVSKAGRCVFTRSHGIHLKQIPLASRQRIGIWPK